MNWIYKIGIGVALGLLIVRGGFVALISLGKVALPFVVGYLAYKQIQKLLQPIGQSGKRPDSFHSSSSSSSHAETIEICPKCGHEKKARHRC